jgi:hypothetical protein
MALALLFLVSVYAQGRSAHQANFIPELSFGHSPEVSPLSASHRPANPYAARHSVPPVRETAFPGHHPPSKSHRCATGQMWADLQIKEAHIRLKIYTDKTGVKDIDSWHEVSAKHLSAYLDEMMFRLNNRYNPYPFRDTMMKLLDPSVLECKHS